MSPVLQRFQAFYQALESLDSHQLAELYDDAVFFQDPAHRLQGLDALKRYFEQLLGGVEQLSFTIHRCDEDEGHAWLQWTMRMVHPRLARGSAVVVDGASYLEFGDKITSHRDYFDLGAMLYEQLPVMGRIIRAIKRRLGA